MQHGKNVKGACSSSTCFLHTLYFYGDYVLFPVRAKRQKGANCGLKAVYLPSQFSATSFSKRSSPRVPLLLPAASLHFHEKTGLLSRRFKLWKRKDLTLFPFEKSFFNYSLTPPTHYKQPIGSGEEYLLLLSNCHLSFPFTFLFLKNIHTGKRFSFNFTNSLYGTTVPFQSCVYKHTSQLMIGFLRDVFCNDAEGT